MPPRKAPAPAAKAEKELEDIDLDNPEFQKVWELVQYTHQSIFLTGKAGTGKSTFLRYITRNTRKPYVVLAPTGIAAVNAGGQTLHSFFRIPFKPLTPDDPDFARDRLRQRMKYSAAMVKMLNKLELIVIDEISMVRADIIDFIDKLLRFYTRNERQPFGGKQLLLVGDVFQLEPVVSADMRDILRPHYRNCYFFNARAFSHLRVVPIELRKVYRQSDPAFISLLDRIRTGHAAPGDLPLLNSRVSVPPQPAAGAVGDSAGDFTITLAARRDMVDHINESHLQALHTPLMTFKGEVKGDFPDNSLPTDIDLALKEGAQVVFIKNDPDHRWVNGTIGHISSLAKDLIEVTLEDGSVHRLKPEKWANVRYTYSPRTKEIIEEELGSFTQYPVKLAWALTVHKSQGLTFSRAVIDLGHGAFTGGQTYVALSRCRSLEGLTLASTVADRDIFVNPAVMAFASTFNDPALISDALAHAHAEGCYSRALKLADGGDLSGAFDAFAEGLRSRSVLDNAPFMRLARRKLGVVNTLRRQVAELQHQLDEDRRRFADIAAEYVSLGLDCLQDDMPLPALANFDKALRLSPDLPDALRGRAKALEITGEHAAAAAAYHRCRQLSGPDFDIYLDEARCLAETADWHNAMDRCMVAADLVDDLGVPRASQARLHLLMAEICDATGDPSGAARHRSLARRLGR